MEGIMSKEVNPFIVVLEGNEPIKKQSYKSNIEYYDSMCFHLPGALANRKFDEEEAARVFTFLKALHYDFQCCDTLRKIFVLRNNGEVEQKWLDAIVYKDKRDSYLWEQLVNIKGRIGDHRKPDSLYKRIARVLGLRKIGRG
jgi:hypothetical protein